jgi:16S rRNA (adenine1518-N6/adenine1519-N6)-dimethyltransferase
MELTSPKIIKELLKKYETRASKGLGQNFLIDKNVLNKIINAADLKPDDFILEVGPGLGVLTQELAEKAKQVVAIEKDKTMIEILKETLRDFKNVVVEQGDILETKNPFIKKYKVVANIPYYLTSPLIRKFLEEKNPPEEMVLMLQEEVAKRICAKPGEMSLLAASVQFYAEAKIISVVSKNCFWPAPKIDSAIIKITPMKKYSISADLFFQVAKAGFLHPRKQLSNNLSEGLKIDKEKTSVWLLKNKISPNARAETLSIENWVELAKSLDAKLSPI